MRPPVLCLTAFLALSACAAPESAPSPSTHAQPLACAVADASPAATVAVDTRFGGALRRTDWSARGNHHPVARFALARDGRAIDLGEALTAALTVDGALVVRASGALERFTRSCPRVIARDALPDLAVSPDGARFAFVLRAGDGTRIELADAKSSRAIASAFAEADRPLFLDERTLLFVGAPKPGASRFHVVALDPADAVPRAIGEGAPLPATREGYAFDVHAANAVVRYDDGLLARTLDPRTGAWR